MTDLPPSPAPEAMPHWLRSMLSGPDNRSIAIGRVIAFVAVGLVLAVLVIGIPVLEATIFTLKKIEPPTWFAFMNTLMAYVASVLAALGAFATAVVALTNQTEPKPPPPGPGQ